MLIMPQDSPGIPVLNKIKLNILMKFKRGHPHLGRQIWVDNNNNNDRLTAFDPGQPG